MKQGIIEHGLRVFISSKCGGPYAIARKALKELLEATGLISVYCFETEPASSEDTVSAYLNQVGESNLCIFLVDNKDGVPAAVLSEQKRAKEEGIRLLYFFNDENEKKSTSMQDEVKASLSEKYKVVHEFSDFAPMAFESVLQDLISVYKNKPMVGDTTEEVYIPQTEIVSVSSEKEGLLSVKGKSFPLTLGVLTKRVLLTDSSRGEDRKEHIDEVLSRILKVVLYEEDNASTLIDQLSDEVKSLYNNKDMADLISKRLAAQKLYYLSRYEDCLGTLQSAIKDALENSTVPAWFVNDIAIDIRHIVERINFGKHVSPQDNIGQKYLDESDDPVYYPYLDRQIATMQEEISKNYYSQLNISPYTTRYGGLEPMFIALTNAFCFAEMHGSIVQTEMVRGRLNSIYAMLCTLYDDYDLLFEFVRLVILDRDSKKLDTLVRTRNRSLERIGAEDVSHILMCVNRIPNEEFRVISKLLLASRLGDCLDDASFQSLFEELHLESVKWVNDEHRNSIIGPYVFNFLRATAFRAHADKTLMIIDLVVKRQFSYYYSDCFRVLQNMDYDSLTNEEQIRIKELFKDMIAQKDASIEQYFPTALIRFCKSAKISVSDLEKVIEQNYPVFYSDTYKLEMLSENSENPSEYVRKMIEETKDRNSLQGINGRYIGYGYDTNEVIYNILLEKKEYFDENLLTDAIVAAMDTLASKYQTVKAKICAIKLLFLLYARGKELAIWKSISEQLIEQKNDYVQGSQPGFFSKERNGDLEFYYCLLLRLVDEKQSCKAIEWILSYEKEEAYSVILMLRGIAAYLKASRGFESNNELLFAFLFVSVEMLQHKERDVRYCATGCLIELSNYDATRRIALSQLSTTMDLGSRDEKIAILNSLSRMSIENEEYRVHLINKGKGDNSYVVRKCAIRAESNIL